jgi:hypothetical protein
MDCLRKERREKSSRGRRGEGRENCKRLVDFLKKRKERK